MLVACTPQVDGVDVHTQIAYLTGPWQMPEEVARVAAGQNVPYEPTPPYRSGAGCLEDGRLMPGITRLSDYVLRHFEGVTHVWNAVYCKASGGVMSQHGMGKAADLMITPLDGDADNERGDRVANWLATNAQRLGVMRIIWDDGSWTAERGTINTGDFGHQDHIHVELNDAGTQALAPWFAERGDEEPPSVGKSGAWAAEFVSLGDRTQRSLWLTQQVGSRAVVSVSFRNIGTEPWRRGQLQLAALNPRDGARDDIMTPRWVSPSRPASLIEDTLPGETATFDVEVQVPDSTTDLYLGLVATDNQATHWFSEFGGPESHDSVFVVIEPAVGQISGCRVGRTSEWAGTILGWLALWVLYATTNFGRRKTTL